MSDGPEAAIEDAVGVEPPLKRPRPDLWIGRYGKAQLHRHLCEATNVTEAIQQVHDEHGIPADPACQVALPFLRLMGIDSNQVASELYQFLRQRLLDQISTLCRPKLLALLQEVFPYARQQFACDVLAAICTSPHLAQVPPAYLQALGADAAVFTSLPLALKQKVWEVDTLKWKQDVMRWLKSYTANAATQAPTVLVAFATNIAPAWKCAGDAVPQLAHAIGPSPALLNETVRMLRELWLKYHHADAGLFLHQLLMEPHFARGEILDSRIHKLATTLDALICSIDHDGRAVREVSAAAAPFRGEDGSGTQIGLLLGHPLASAALARHALLRSMAVGNPESDETVQSATRLLAMGSPAGAAKATNAAAMARQVLGAKLYRQLSKLAPCSADTETSALRAAPAGAASPEMANGAEIDPRLRGLLHSNPVAQALVFFRCLQLVCLGEASGLAMLLDSVVELGDDRLGVEDAWLEALSTLALATPVHIDVVAVLLQRLFKRSLHIEAAAHAYYVLMKGLAEVMPGTDLEILMNTCGVEFPTLQDDDEMTLSSTAESVA